MMERVSTTSVIALAKMAWNKPLIISEEDEEYTVYVPSSISYSRMGKSEFERLVENIDKVLQIECGFSMNDLREAVLCDAQ